MYMMILIKSLSKNSDQLIKVNYAILILNNMF